MKRLPTKIKVGSQVRLAGLDGVYTVYRICGDSKTLKVKGQEGYYHAENILSYGEVK